MEVTTAVGRWVLGDDGIARDKTYARGDINVRARIDEHEDGNNFIISWDELREDKDGKFRATQFHGCPVEIVRQIVGPPENDGDDEKEALKARVGELELEREKLRQFYEKLQKDLRQYEAKGLFEHEVMPFFEAMFPEPEIDDGEIEF